MTKDEERLAKLGYGSPKGYKVTKRGNKLPISDKGMRYIMRERRRKKAEKLAAKLPERREKRRLGRRLKKVMKKIRASVRKVRFPFHPYLLMRKVGDDSVAINSTLTCQQCRDLARLDRQHRLANRAWVGIEVYTIHLAKKGVAIEQIYPVAKFLTVSKKKK